MLWLINWIWLLNFDEECFYVTGGYHCAKYDCQIHSIERRTEFRDWATLSTPSGRTVQFETETADLGIGRRMMDFDIIKPSMNYASETQDGV